MLEMLMRQFLGDIDVNQVKIQMQQFASLFVQMQKNTELSLQILQRIEAKISNPADVSANIPLIGAIDNDNGNNNGSGDNGTGSANRDD